MFPVIVSDNSTPALTATQTLTVDLVPSSIQGPSVKPLPIEDAVIGSTLQLNVSQYVSDPNVPPLKLTYALGSNPPAGASIDPNTGILTFTPTADQPIGNTSIELTVSDNLSPPDTSYAYLEVQVFAAGTIPSPIIQSIPTQNVVAGQELQLNVSQYASDPDSLPLTYSLQFGPPSGATIDPNTGILTWTPTIGQTGANTIWVEVEDNQSPPATTLQTVTVDVFLYSPPVLQTIPTQSRNHRHDL